MFTGIETVGGTGILRTVNYFGQQIPYLRASIRTLANTTKYTRHTAGFRCWRG